MSSAARVGGIGALLHGGRCIISCVDAPRRSSRRSVHSVWAWLGEFIHRKQPLKLQPRPGRHPRLLQVHPTTQGLASITLYPRSSAIVGSKLSVEALASSQTLASTCLPRRSRIALRGWGLRVERLRGRLSERSLVSITEEKYIRFGNCQPPPDVLQTLTKFLWITRASLPPPRLCCSPIRKGAELPEVDPCLSPVSATRDAVRNWTDCRAASISPSNRLSVVFFRPSSITGRA